MCCDFDSQLTQSNKCDFFCRLVRKKRKTFLCQILLLLHSSPLGSLHFLSLFHETAIAEIHSEARCYQRRGKKTTRRSISCTYSVDTVSPCML